MAMKPCEKCLETRWGGWEKIDGWHRATCQNCGNEVEWKPWKKPPAKFSWHLAPEGMEAGTPCPKCATRVERREHKQQPPAGTSYLTHWFVCTDKMCKRIYFSESARVKPDGSAWPKAS